jgi:thiamine kinase-like enzyme
MIFNLALLFSGCTTHFNSDVGGKNEIENVAKKFAAGDKTGLKEIEGGLSDSEVYVFKSNGGQKYILKKSGNWPDRDGKLVALEMNKFCAFNGISPRLLYVDDEDNPKIVVMDYIDGRIFSIEDFYNDKILYKIVENLKRLHDVRISPAFKKVSLLQELQASVARVKKKKVALPSKFDNWYKHLLKLFSEFKSSAMVQCHCDLGARNILIENEEKIYFIDFQCTLCESPLFDIAHLLYKSDLDDEEIVRKILKQYLGHKATNAEMKKVLFYKSVNAFVVGHIRVTWLQNTTTAAELDDLMSRPTASSSRYLRRGDLTKREFNELSQREKIEYALSFFKDFLKFGKEMGIDFNEGIK